MQSRHSGKTMRGRGQAGFTLIELMVSLAISGIILAGVMQAFISQHKAYLAQEDLGELQQTARATMTMLQRDIASARYGAPSTSLGSWLTGVATNPAIVGNPTLYDGAGGMPDMITYLWVDHTESTTLAQPIVSGDKTFTVQPSQGTIFENAPIPIFFVGEFLNGNIASVSGDVININLANLISGGGGGGGGGKGKKNGGQNAQKAATNNEFTWDFPAGTMAGVVRQVTYYWVQGNASASDACPASTSCLMRHNGRTAYDPLTGDVVAYDIEDFQIVQDNDDNYLVTLTVRAPRVDPDFKGSADGYRRMTVTERMVVRNPGTFVFN